MPGDSDRVALICNAGGASITLMRQRIFSAVEPSASITLLPLIKWEPRLMCTEPLQSRSTGKTADQAHTIPNLIDELQPYSA